MPLLSLFPGDTLWTLECCHSIDERGYARVAQEYTEVEICSPEKYAFVVKSLLAEREARGFRLYNTVEKRWILEEGTAHLSTHTLLEPSSVFHGYVRPSPYHHVHDKVEACIIRPCLFEPPLVPRRRVKTIQVAAMEPVTVEEEVVEVDEQVVYDEVRQQYVLRKTPKVSKVVQPVYDEHPLFDEHGNTVGTHKVVRKVEKIRVEPVMGHDGRPLMEDVVDETGNVVMVPAYEVRYLNEKGEGILRMDYEALREAGKTVHRAICVECGVVKQPKLHP